MTSASFQNSSGLPAKRSHRVMIGCAISSVLAYLVGRPILKLKGHYLAIATLGLGVLVALDALGAPPTAAG